MKITRILPKSIAKAWQGHDIENLKHKLWYAQGTVRFYQELLDEAEAEMRRLEGGDRNVY